VPNNIRIPLGTEMQRFVDFSLGALLVPKFSITLNGPEYRAEVNDHENSQVCGCVSPGR